MSASIISLFNLCSVILVGKFQSPTDSITDFILQVQQKTPVILDHVDISEDGRYKYLYDKNRNGEELSGRALKPLSQKCIGTRFSHVIFSNWATPSITIRKVYVHVVEVIRGISFLNENPEFIFIHLHPKYIMDNPPFKIIWQQFSFKSISFLLYGDSIKLVLTCCSYSFLKLIPFEYRSEDVDVDQFLLRVKSKLFDFRNGIVVLRRLGQGKNKGGFNLRDCSLNLDGLLTFPAECGLRAIQRKYNFTLKYNEAHGNRLKFVSEIFERGMDNRFKDKLTKGHEQTREWFLHGMSFEPFIFMVFADPNPPNASAVLSPFDIWIWLSFLLSIVLFFLVSWVILFRKYSGKLILWIFSSIFSQLGEDETFILFGNSRGKYFTLFFCWLFISNLLGIVYQGSLFSYLTATESPNVPKTLKEALTNPSFPIINVDCTNNEEYRGLNRRTEFYEQNATIICISVLKYVLIHDLLSTDKELKTEHHHDYFILSLELLKERLIVINGTAYQIIKDITTFRQLQTEYEGQTVLLPREFGVLNQHNRLMEFTRLMKWLDPNKLIMKSDDMARFIMRSTWIAKRNLFHRIFSSGLGSLVQSGLFSMWEKHYALGRERVGVEQNHRVTFGRIQFAESKVITFNEAHPVSLRVMRVFFVIWFILLICISGAFILEKFYFQKRMVLVQCTSYMKIKIIRCLIISLNCQEYR
jgi:hypothetical protein